MIRKSEVEEDALIILSSLEKDYEIPTSWMTVKPVLKSMVIVYCLLIISAVVNAFVYRDNDYPMDILWGGVFFSVISSVILTLVALMMSHGSITMLMCVPKNVRDDSILINIARKKLKVYGCGIVAINIIVAFLLISERSDFIIGYGVSWFACMLIGGFAFSMSMSRYMTPAVTATLSKIGEALSSPSK